MATISQHSILHIHNGTGGGGIPHGLGLLTTVASLPPKYRSRYLNIKTKSEIPLDLSVKPISPQIASDVPIATSFTEVYTEPSPTSQTERFATSATCSPFSQTETENETIPAITTTKMAHINPHHCPHPLPQQQQQTQASHVVVIAAEVVKPITPPLTPASKRKHGELAATINVTTSAEDVELEHCMAIATDSYENPPKLPKTEQHPTTKREMTPTKPIRQTDTAPKTAKAHPPAAKPTKNKATRKLKFDEETSSPVSGTIIRPLEDITDAGAQYSNGDIDPKYNIVEITEETKAELAAIKNVIGDYICKLCRIKFEDAFGLARHRCACIVLLEYRCPECGKQFNCPANLASHRRWHKPKKDSGAAQKKENRNTTNIANAARPLKVVNAADIKITSEEASFGCNVCGRKFKRQAYLRKHQLTHASNKAIVPLQTLKTQEGSISVSANTIVSTSQVAESVGSAYHSYAGSAISNSSRSSMHSYSGTQEDEGVYTVASGYDYEADTMSECSTSSAGYGRLQIVESGLTEEENIAATALTNLRNCASVIQHTTLAH